MELSSQGRALEDLMERRSFLTLLPLMPMAGKLMVVLPQKKYMSLSDLNHITLEYIGPRLVDQLFQEMPIMAHLRMTAETPEGKELIEEWTFEAP